MRFLAPYTRGTLRGIRRGRGPNSTSARSPAEALHKALRRLYTKLCIKLCTMLYTMLCMMLYTMLCMMPYTMLYGGFARSSVEALYKALWRLYIKLCGGSI